jgi:hypothetical protein
MALVSLKKIEQDTWLKTGGGPSRGGVCYYMCSFLESDLGTWNKPGTFVAAVSSAQNFAAGTAMMNYAKAQSLKKAPQTLLTAYLERAATGLTANRIYRAALWVGAIGGVVGEPNHEIIIVTGSNNDVVYFEPNFGFFQASDAGKNNAQAIEFFINQQYGQYNMKAGNFQYMNVRSNTASTPKGFPI